MQVTADAVLFLADYQGDLAVGFQALQTIDDVTAGLFNLFAQLMLFSSSKRAFNSTSTVTCLPFSAALISAATMGSYRNAVQCLLDGQHVFVFRGLLDKAHHHVEAFVGVVDIRSFSRMAWKISV